MRSSPGVFSGVISAILLVVLWLAHLAAREVFPRAPGDPVRLIITLCLVACFAFFIVAQVRLARSEDEFHRQLQLMARSVAYPVAVVLVFAIGYLRGEGLLIGADPRDLWMLLLLPYFAGRAVAAWRYRETAAR
jgi:hypothetical protein